MGFAESLSTLSMDKHERERYYEMANSSDPAMRQAAREKLNGGKVTPLDLVKIYAQARVTASIEYQKEQYSDMKQMIQNLTRDNPTYDNISLDMQDKIKAVYANKDKDQEDEKSTSVKKEKTAQELFAEMNDTLSDVLPQGYGQYDEMDVNGPEME